MPWKSYVFCEVRVQNSVFVETCLSGEQGVIILVQFRVFMATYGPTHVIASSNYICPWHQSVLAASVSPRAATELILSATSKSPMLYIFPQCNCCQLSLMTITQIGIPLTHASKGNVKIPTCTHSLKQLCGHHATTFFLLCMQFLIFQKETLMEMYVCPGNYGE